MEKCRLCLENKKNLRSIFDVQDDHTFASMITSLSNIKIMQNDGVTDKICLSCRRKLKEAFDFRLMIIRSDAALQSYSNCKKICFDTLGDIQIIVEITGNEKCTIKKENSIAEYFNNDETSILYNGTTIKKVESVVNTESQPLLLMDFLNTIKDDGDNDLDDTYNVDYDYEPVSDDDDDDEYLLPLSIRRKAAKKKNHKKQKNAATVKSKEPKNIHSETGKLKIVPKPIKPVYMSDMRVVPTKCCNTKPKVQKIKKNRTKKEICYHCGKFTSSLKSHILIHTGERTFKCDICSKGFFTKKLLEQHIKLRHIVASERNIKCDFCVATFSSISALQSHLITHSEERQYTCNDCNKTFKRRGALRRHQLVHNITNKNIYCQQCNMSFFTKYGLNHHMRVHTGERPYNCEICSQPYSYKHDFNRHCLKKHGVFLKRRSVNVMNEEILERERTLMRDLMLKLNGPINADENINPFDGPQAAQAFEMAVNALKSRQIPIDL